MEGNKQGYIRVSHLVYIIIIAVIVLSFFLVIAFGGTENAGTMMGTASTVSSLILSVIAIVLSLIDVAGQRQTMVDLKETADKLHESNESAAVLTQELMTKINDLQDMKEQMVEAVKESDEWRKGLDEWRKGLVEEIRGLKQKDDIKSEDLENLYEKANKSISVNLNDFKNEIKYNPNKNKKDPQADSVIHYLKNKFELNETLAYEEFMNILQNECNVPLSSAKNISKWLTDQDYTYQWWSESQGPLVTLQEKIFK